MSEPFKTMIPPLAISRVLIVYEHEDGSHVALVANGKKPTGELLDTVEKLIALKRQEIAMIADRECAQPLPERQ